MLWGSSVCEVVHNTENGASDVGPQGKASQER